MNRLTALLQSLALSLLLVGGAHATAAKSVNKASVVASASASHAHHASSRSSKKTPQKVNINTADANALHDSLINIGPSKAAAIVSWRKQHGAFHSADELAQVKGIGLKTIEKNRSYIVVGSVAAASKH